MLTAASCRSPTDRPGDREGHVPGEIRRHPERRSGLRVRWRLQTPPHRDPALKLSHSHLLPTGLI